MGIIQKQSIQSTFFVAIGFAIGAFNLLLLAPKVLTADQLGLTRIITDAGVTLATLCTFGCLPIIYKFSPFYRSNLPGHKNDLPFITLVACLVGFVVMCTVGYATKDILIRKFSTRSPLFVEYSYLVYPFCFFMLMFIWLESFGWAYKRGVISNTLREIVPRALFTLLLTLLSFEIISLSRFLTVFAFSYLLPALMLFIVLRKTGEFSFNTKVSSVTTRLGGKMVNFGLFLFGAQFLNLLSRTADTFILTAKSSRGLTDTAVFTIATYVVTLMEVPQRSINSISTAVLAESWRTKDIGRISRIYTKSVNNLLLIGLVMFSLIWLNASNLTIYLGKDYDGIKEIVFLMGIGKLIDLGTGANAQIIGTSSYWKVDFFTNVIYTIVALPLNYILISYYGLIGAAYSYLIAITFYNLLRFGFLWYKLKLQPYTWKEGFAVLIAAACAAIAHYIPVFSNFIVDSAVRTTVFCLLFIPVVYYSRISSELNELVFKYLKIGRGSQ